MTPFILHKEIVMKVLIISCLLAVFGFANHHHHDHGATSAQQHITSKQIIDAMHMPMMHQETPFQGEIETFYLTDMIPHHQGAIDSAKLLLPHTDNKTLQKLLTNIITTQEKEINAFKTLLEKGVQNTQIPESQKEAFISESKESMNKMMATMMAPSAKTDSAQENIQKDFCIAMIAHHQGAIESSKILLKYSKNDTVRSIAKRIIKDQEKEIKLMQKLIEKL